MQLVKKVSIFTVMAAMVVWMAFPVSVAHAASFSTAEDHLNLQRQSVTSGVSHNVAFTVPAGNTGTEAKVTVVFPNADDGLWCRTADVLTAAGSTTFAANELPGTLTAACVKGTDGSSYDTITISGVTNLTAATEYGVLITDPGAGKLGTPTTGTTGLVTVNTLTSGDAPIDSAQIALDIIANDQVAVAATVEPTISVSLTSNSINLGVLSASLVSQDSTVSEVTTNAGNGYTSTVYYSGTMSSGGGKNIADTAGGTIAIGTEEFGVSTSESTQDVATWSPAACTDTASTSNATALSTSVPKTFAGATGPVTADQATLCFLASIAGTTAAGSYTTTVTIVTTGLF
ncbi:MAG: hypothetical protein V1916_00870 [Patescibacteria group bacterium]